MEFVGRLASGVTDHFNNILIVIHGHASVLLKKTNDPAMVEQLNQISSAASCAGALSRRWLMASGRPPIQPEPLDLNRLIRDQGHTRKRLVGERIHIECNYGCVLAPTLCDRYLLKYILINRVLNARDAMSQGGTISISTATVRLDNAQVSGRVGKFVHLSVSDGGCGMTPEVQANLFEPFGSSAGKGMGLGLAGVYGEVRQRSGCVEYSTEVGVGTEFRVYFPSASAAGAIARLES